MADQRTTRSDFDRFFDYDIHVPSRTMFMGDECNEVMAELAIKGMHLMESASKEKPIHILMNNIGGCEYHAMAIYDAIACSPCHVTITAFGHAMSAGSWILQAADKRRLAPNCTVMFHYGHMTNEGEVKYVRVRNKEMERMNVVMENHYFERMQAKDPSFSRTKLKKLLEAETFFSAPDAVEMGLADEVLTIGK